MTYGPPEEPAQVNQAAGEGDAPPSYDKVVGGAGPTVTCRVCHTTINIEGKVHQHVVKCNQCGEATPLRVAPAGKKYVRCPCNRLLICKAAENQIFCSTPNCKRVITLGASPVGTAVRAPPGTCRVSCAHCSEIFMFNTLNNALARCPHCRNMSSVGRKYTRSRALIFLTGFIFMAIGIGIGLTVPIPDIRQSAFVWIEDEEREEQQEEPTVKRQKIDLTIDTDWNIE